MQTLLTNSSRRVILAYDPRSTFRELLKHSANLIPVENDEADEHDLYWMIKPTGVQWVIAFLSSDGQMPAALDALLMKYPAIPILAIAANGNPSDMKWIEFPQEMLTGVPFDELLAGLYTVFLSNLIPNYGPTEAQYVNALDQSVEGAYPGW